MGRWIRLGGASQSWPRLHHLIGGYSPRAHGCIRACLDRVHLSIPLWSVGVNGGHWCALAITRMREAG
ncbi:hypothetical protein EBZ35_02230 [bacterium]|nr:hypothetical protein [bacterium]